MEASASASLLMIRALHEFTATSTMAIGKARRSADSAPAHSRARIAAISRAGTSRPAFTNTNRSLRINSRCFSKLRRIAGHRASPDERSSEKRRAVQLDSGIIPSAPATTPRSIPKSWFDYKWDKFPAHVVLEQFSPGSSRTTTKNRAIPVAVYRWHAENPTNKAVTVSVLALLDEHGRLVPTSHARFSIGTQPGQLTIVHAAKLGWTTPAR